MPKDLIMWSISTFIEKKRAIQCPTLIQQGVLNPSAFIHLYWTFKKENSCV